MAKAVFRSGELIHVPEKKMIETHVGFADYSDSSVSSEMEVSVEAEPETVEKYLGPTADDLRREAEEFKAKWESEKQALIESAKAEAAEIVRTASATAESEKQQAITEADAIRASAKEEVERTIADAKQQAEALTGEIRKALDDEKKEAIEQGREEGRTQGYTEGNAEVERLVERTRIVLERAQDKRGEILADTEREIVDLVLLVCRKVVKVISENQREVVISNVVQALRKVKDRGNIIIRVNLADLKLTTAHTQNFIKLLEGAKSIQVAEDSSIDPGGCVIETDFGEIDARISSQLSELEAKILEVSPIKSRVKASSGIR